MINTNRFDPADSLNLVLSVCCSNACRWNMEAKEELPEYMKPIYNAMLELGSELADSALKNNGLNTLPYIKNEVINLSYLIPLQFSAT